MDISLALEILGAGTPFDYGGSATENDKASYDALQWNDQRTKPAWAEIQSVNTSIENTAVIQQQIDVLKESVTGDIIREALFDKGGQAKQKVKDIDDAIDALRAQLP